MHKILIFIACILFACNLCGQQTDTTYIQTSEEAGELTAENLVEARELAYRMQEPANLALKWDIIKIRGDCSLERKFTPAFSTNVEFIFELANSNRSRRSIGMNIEPRWFPFMASRIRSGQQANNLSGQYAGLEIGYERYLNDFKNHRKSAMLYLGMQRRFLNDGFFDIGIGAGFQDFSPTPFSRGGTYFVTRTRARFGLAAFLPASKNRGQSCEVLRCFREERHMWKVDLYNLLEVNASSFINSVKLQPGIAYEQKLGASPFSVQAEIQTRFLRGKYISGFSGQEENLVQRTMEVGAYLQPRFYFLQKHLIANGKSGNNLSGLYLGAQAGIRWIQEKTAAEVPSQSGSSINRQWSAAPVLGIQHRFLRNGFVDFTFGAGLAKDNLSFKNIQGDPLPSDANEVLLHLIGNLRIGWAF
jgi:hypothetical protein